MESLARTANRGSVSTEYNVDNSVKLEPDNTEYLSRTIGSTSNRKTFTVSCWFKRTELKSGAADANGHNLFFSGVDSTNMVSMQFHTWQDTYADTLEFRVVGSSNNNTTRRFRDTSAWYHVVLAVDTTQATEANRWKLYVNGVQETSFSQTSYPSQNADTVNNVANNVMRIGTKPYGGNEFGYFAGYIADYYHIDGEALAPTDFGEFDGDSGIWKPKAYTGSFGTNGWYLDFVDGSDLGDDESGNGNDFTENNLAAIDQATDTPTNNFATLNAVNLSTQTLTEGATKVVSSDNSARTAYGTIAPSSGKWWWEGKIQVFESSDAYACIGVTTNLAGLPSTSAQLSGGHCIKLAKAQKWVLNDTGYADNDIINVGLDLDNQKFYTYKNGSIDDANGIDISSTTFDGFGSQWMPLVIVYGSGGASGYEMNFGGYGSYTISSSASDANGYGNFEYAPPSGYYALCTKNLAEYG